MRAARALVVVSLLGAALASSAAAHAQPTRSAETDAKEKSRAAFRKGVAQLRAQDWAGARASFESAYALFAHPSILLNLAIARLRTDDPVRAEQDLVKFLSEDGGASPDELASAREALAEARTRLGTLRVIVVPATARVAVDGKPVETVRRADAGDRGVVAELRIKPGRHVVDIDADGFKTEHRTLDVPAKGEAASAFELVANAAVTKPEEPTAPQETSVRTIVGWSLVGLAGVAAVTGGITALHAKSLSNDYADASNAHFQDPSTRSTGIGFRTAADVSLGIAIVSGATALVLLLTDVGKSSPSTSAAQTAVLTW